MAPDLKSLTSTEASTRAAPLRIVIDSNVVLDWLLFRDSTTAALGPAIEAGELKWIATAAMLAEHRRVFAADLAAAWGTEPSAFDSAWHRWGALDGSPVAPCGLRCTDPDDQIFIDFAIARSATWLLTRDRALLKLARRARERGVAVLRPAQWTPRAQ